MINIRGTILALGLAVLTCLGSRPVQAETPVAPLAGSAGQIMPHSQWAQHSASCPAAHQQEGAHQWQEHIESLELTGEQRTAIKAIAERFQPRFIDLAQRGTGVREQLTLVSPEDPGYAEATEQAAQTAAAIASDGVRTLSEMRAAVNEVLSPSQRLRLKDQLVGDRKKWDDWRARHRAAPQ